MPEFPVSEQKRKNLEEKMARLNLREQDTRTRIANDRVVFGEA